MPLFANFIRAPGEQPQHYFRRLIIDIKKIVKNGAPAEELEEVLQEFINASKNMNWHIDTTGVYHVDEGVRAANRVFTEFKRYLEQLRAKQEPEYRDVISALEEIERLLANHKAT